MNNETSIMLPEKTRLRIIQTLLWLQFVTVLCILGIGFSVFVVHQNRARQLRLESDVLDARAESLSRYHDELHADAMSLSRMMGERIWSNRKRELQLIHSPSGLVAYTWDEPAPSEMMRGFQRFQAEDEQAHVQLLLNLATQADQPAIAELPDWVLHEQLLQALKGLPGATQQVQKEAAEVLRESKLKHIDGVEIIAH
jgi:hypothetical protein